MNFKSNWLWGFCLIGLFACGCSSSQNIVRGQNAAEPHVPGPAYAHPVGSTYTNHMADGWQPGSNHNTYGYQFNGSGDCEECKSGGDCDRRGHCRGKKHAHRHFYHYDAPKDLVYPQQNQPAAVVQYPYYTCKGPDDFFLK